LVNPFCKQNDQGKSFIIPQNFDWPHLWYTTRTHPRGYPLHWVIPIMDTPKRIPITLSETLTLSDTHYTEWYRYPEWLFLSPKVLTTHPRVYPLHWGTLFSSQTNQTLSDTHHTEWFFLTLSDTHHTEWFFLTLSDTQGQVFNDAVNRRVCHILDRLSSKICRIRWPRSKTRTYTILKLRDFSLKILKETFTLSGPQMAEGTTWLLLVWDRRQLYVSHNLPPHPHPNPNKTREIPILGRRGIFGWQRTKCGVFLDGCDLLMKVSYRTPTRRTCRSRKGKKRIIRTWL
jgi:hypothetical protein